MGNTFCILINDSSGKKIGELPTATNVEVMQLINKGFVVIDVYTGRQLTLADVEQTVCVSEGFIDIG